LKPILRIAALAAATYLAPGAYAQRSSADSSRRVELTKTVQLHHLSNDDAVRLLTPYLLGQGAAYTMGGGMHAVTIRATAKGIADAEHALAEYDRSPVTLTLNFQLIAAVDTPTRDPAVAGLDSVLRGVLKFAGYRLLSTAVARVSEGSSASQTLAGDADMNYALSYTVTRVEGAGSNATVHLTVVLVRRAADGRPGPSGRLEEELFSTGVTIPLGNTVVLGSAVESNSVAGNVASPRGDTTRVNWTARPGARQRGLILTVRPVIDATSPRD